MHILFLTDNFPPEGNAPATRTYEHAREWVKLGHKVTIITGAPNFPEGKVFDGYENRWFQKEYLEGIQVRRVKTYITANEGFVKRVLDFLSFMVSSFVAGFFVKKVDVIVSTSPQLFTALSGWALSGIRRKPFVFELRDIWPASITAVGAMKTSLVIKFLEKLEIFLYKRADMIISVTNSFKKELIGRGIAANNIEVVLNGVDLAQYSPVEEKDLVLAESNKLVGKFVIGYVGTHGMAHALETVVSAAEILKDYEDIRFLFAGGGAAKPSIEQLITSKNLSNVVSLPRQSKVDMPKVWSLCDISLISLKDAALFKTVIPSKIFESMGMGIPMIASIPTGEASAILERTKSGVVVAPESPQLLAQEILNLYNNKPKLLSISKNSAVSAVLFSRAKLAQCMLENFEILLSK
jgi:glycosyltransferase involved in cell wall biosynthesis|tara:strand:- start:86 stop:1312 length:1227 start_codon:yes stop_codon:yes gene_type:complete